MQYLNKSCLIFAILVMNSVSFANTSLTLAQFGMELCPQGKIARLYISTTLPQQMSPNQLASYQNVGLQGNESVSLNYQQMSVNSQNQLVAQFPNGNSIVIGHVTGSNLEGADCTYYQIQVNKSIQIQVSGSQKSAGFYKSSGGVFPFPKLATDVTFNLTISASPTESLSASCQYLTPAVDDSGLTNRCPR